MTNGRMTMKNLLNDQTKGHHHWWPAGIQRKIWVREDGYLTRRRGEELKPFQPGNSTGASDDAHYFDMGASPWTHSFEDAFDLVDAQGAQAVRNAVKVVKASPYYRLSRWPLTRWLPYRSDAIEERKEFLSDANIHALGRLVVSIVLRSPTYRFEMSLPRPSMPEGTPIDFNLGKTNLWLKWAPWFQNAQRPKLPMSAIFLIGHWKREFVFGDGFFETLLGQPAWPEPTKGVVLYPLAPEVCVLLSFNSRAGQQLVILSQKETTQINRIICASSRGEIYFRNQDEPSFQPADHDAHRSVKLDTHHFLNKWIDRA